MDELSLDAGRELILLARKSIEEYLKNGRLYKPKSLKFVPDEERGVFVSLYEYPSHELRGCIGFPMPIYKLSEGTVRAAIAAATEDPRFPPVKLEELKGIVVEVSVLTVPEKVTFSSPKELPSKILIGRDGLMIKSAYGQGLLLPQVPVEYGWDAEEFLCHLCLKAGLSATYWLSGKFELYKFTAEVFAEESPKGNVVKKPLIGCRA